MRNFGGPTSRAHFMAIHDARRKQRKDGLQRALSRYRHQMLENPTPLEIKVENILDALEIPFIRQEIIGRYIVDFKIVFHGLNLIIEADGFYHEASKQRRRDQGRDNALKSLGYKVLHIRRHEFYDEDLMIRKINDFVFGTEELEGALAPAQGELKAVDDRSVSRLNPVNSPAAKISPIP